MFLNKKFISIFILNIFLVFIINIIAFFYTYQINLKYFLYFLAFFVIFGFILILFELLFFIARQIKKRNYFFSGFLVLLILLFILKFSFFGEYFYFRYENYLHFKDYFFTDFNIVLNNLLGDFRNFNGIVLINYLKAFFPKQGNTQYYIYNFFQFISGIYLYRLFSLFSKNKILISLLTFLYFGIEIFFVISYSITYVNIILSSFIIFLFSLFNLEKKKNIVSYILYFVSYLFLVVGRPDFFFLALMIEFLNAYFKNKDIISLKQNILFYILLIPYYFIINNYLLIHISDDKGLLGKTYETDNFWYIIFDKIFGENMQIKLINNLHILSNDYLFGFFMFFVIFGLFFVFYRRVKEIIFNYLFLLIYIIFFFFVVIFIHKEGFVSSFFKYFSLIYLIIYILFGLFIIFLFKFINKNYRILGYIMLSIFIIFNYNISLGNYNKLLSYSYRGINNGTLFRKFNKAKINISIYDRIYDTLWWQNTLYKTVFLKNNLNNGCKNILIGKFEKQYTYLYPEYNIFSYLYFYEELLNDECINLIRVLEGNHIGFSNLNNNLLKKLNKGFKVEKIYDKFIEKDKWLNLYILKNKNAK